MLYDRTWYSNHRDGSGQSADVVLSHLLGLISIRSACDVGCGLGEWLRALRERGVADVLGIDGDHVPRDMLRVSAADFLIHDLTTPLALERRFDLAMSLEVAEHLPERCGELFVDVLIGLSDVVLFSAAIPGQGGTGHINEQWQDYWAGLFAARGYRAIDCIRPLIWTDQRVEFWYRQNTIVYVNPAGLERHPQLREFAASDMLSVVHPKQFELSLRRYRSLEARRPTMPELFKELPLAVKRSIRTRVSRFTKH